MTLPPPPDAFLSPLPGTGLLGFDGPDARAFLQAQLSNDADALVPGRGQWTSYNSAKGRVLANFWLWQRTEADAAFDALVAADLAAAMQKRLSMFVLRSKVRVIDRTAACRLFGVAGPNAATALRAAFGAVPGTGEAIGVLEDAAQVVALPDRRFVVVTPHAGADAVADALLAHRATRADEGRWRAAGIAAGVPWVTAATSDHFVAQMINLDALAGISFQKGCYPGQEVVARMRYLGRLKERLFRLSAAAPPPAPGTRLYSPAFGDTPCGTVVDAAPAELGRSEFLAVVQLAAIGGPGLTLGAPGGAAVDPRALPYDVPDLAPPPRRAG